MEKGASSMAGESLQSRLQRRFEGSPEGRALAFYDRSGELFWRSFDYVYRAALERAALLNSQGVRPGDVCILIPENDEFSTTNLLAVLVLGAVPVCSAPPIVRGRHSNLKDILDYLIRKTKAKAVIANEHIATLIGGLNRSSRNVRFLFGPFEPASSIGSVDPRFPAATDVAALQLTSGTTGFPKICVWSHKAVLAALDGMVSGMKLTPRDVCVNWTPLYHDMGLVNNFLLCMVQGVPLVMLSTFDFVKNPAIWLKALSEVKATTTWAPNFGFAITAGWVRDDQIEGVRLDSVRAFWNAAERIHLETIKTFRERFAPYGVSLDALKTNLGLAENIGGATFSDPDGMFVVERLDSDCLSKRGIAKTVAESDDQSGTVTAVGVGRPYPGLSVEIVSRMRRALPDGHVGEIAFISPSRMNGYLGNARETKKVLTGDLLCTGDVGYQRDGEVFWLGRVRERINLNGRKFDPSDFERILLRVDGLREGCFAAFGVDDHRVGSERLVIVAEKRHSSPLSEKRILKQIAGSVSSYLGARVSEVILLGEGTMTKTSSGKRRHRHYRELYLNGELQPLAQLKMP
jgi:acyl-CoA synthetase (AMP-forming)/AMP-acid ligase II